MIDFQININKPLSRMANELGLYNSKTLIHFIQKIPYGRTSNRTDVSLVFSENRGTCSSKHALIKAIATENHILDLELIIGLYRMTEKNTPKIGKELTLNNLEYIPEAHCYLKYNNQPIDITSNNSNFEVIKNAIIEEISIEPHQIGNFKVSYHKNCIREWLNENNLSFSFNEIWSIREQCIKNLSQS